MALLSEKNLFINVIVNRLNPSSLLTQVYPNVYYSFKQDL